MNTLWTVLIAKSGEITIKNGDFTCVASDLRGLNCQLESNRFSSGEIVEVLRQLSATGKATINIRPNDTSARQMDDSEVELFSRLSNP